MSEVFKRAILDRVEKNTLLGIREDVASRGMNAVHDHIQKQFQLWNIAPEYAQERAGNALQMRQKLNTEAGIIISNHPGYMDVPAILNCITRDDIKIIVDEKGYVELRNIIGEKYLLPAVHGPELRAVLNAVESHINSGGLFLIFPTGGGSDEFQSGFVSILSRMSPDKMVYAFHVDPKAISEIESLSHGRQIGIASATFVHPSTNINKLRRTKLFQVNECYTQAKEWQNLSASGVKRRDKSALLTKHYRELFAS